MEARNLYGRGKVHKKKRKPRKKPNEAMNTQNEVNIRFVVGRTEVAATLLWRLPPTRPV